MDNDTIEAFRKMTPEQRANFTKGWAPSQLFEITRRAHCTPAAIQELNEKCITIDKHDRALRAADTSEDLSLAGAILARWPSDLPSKVSAHELAARLGVKPSRSLGAVLRAKGYRPEGYGKTRRWVRIP